MRRLHLIAALMGAACATPPCDLAACGAACEAAGLHVLPPGAPLHEASLTAFELDALRTELEDIRAGARLAPGLTGVCAGTERCERPFGVDVDGLPDGTYHLSFATQLPRRARPGDWEGVVARTCVVEVDGVRTEARLSAPVSIQPDEGRVVMVQGLPFTVPTPEDGWDCAWRLTLRGPEARVQTFEGRFRTGSLATERTQAPVQDPPAGEDDAPEEPTDGEQAP